MTAVLTQQSGVGLLQSGLIYITNVSSSHGNVSKYFKSNTVPANSIIERVDTDTNILSVEIEVESTNDFNIPSVTLNGLPVTLQVTNQEHRRYRGIIEDVDFTDENSIIASSSNGATHIVEKNYSNVAPVISNVQITSAPQNQITFKQYDEFTISGKLSVHGFVHLLDFEATSGTEYIETDIDGNFSITFNISNRNGDLHIKLSGKSQLGTLSQDYISDFIIPVDNSEIGINFSYIEYPIGQAAIKNQEVGIAHFISLIQQSDYDDYDFLFGSPDNSLIFFEADVFSTSKQFHALIDTNLESNNNISLLVTKKSNKKTKELNAFANIYNENASFILEGNSIILDSGSGSKIHSFNLVSDILLKALNISNISVINNLDIEISPITHENLYSKVFSFSITVKHSSKRGNFTLEFEYTTGSGETFQHSENFIIMGFDPIEVSFDAWPNRKAMFGVEIWDIDKVEVYNLSKDNEINYINNKNNQENYFTIIDENENIRLNGKYLYNNDLMNSVSNTTGELKFSIMEKI